MCVKPPTSLNNPFSLHQKLTQDPKTGLQTPRLKRLAEIVSQQAIAQQEKLEFGSQVGDEYDDGQSVTEMADVEQDGEGRPSSVVASAA